MLTSYRAVTLPVCDPLVTEFNVDRRWYDLPDAQEFNNNFKYTGK